MSHRFSKDPRFYPGSPWCGCSRCGRAFPNIEKFDRHRCRAKKQKA